MLILISPAKTLDFNDNVPKKVNFSQPKFYQEANELVHILQTYSVKDLAKLMDLSEKLSDLNYQRFQKFLNQIDQNNKSSFKQAIYAYKGDVYQGFTLESYHDKELKFANDHLRIISGLYGLLKPLDLIQPYRLEMSMPIPNLYGKNLYDFWNNKITNALNDEKSDVIINLASQEYSSAILKNKLNKPIINITFKEKSKDRYKIIGLHAKKARGSCANFIICNSIDRLEDIKKFNLNNYQFRDDFSSEEEYVFVR